MVVLYDLSLLQPHIELTIQTSNGESLTFWRFIKHWLICCCLKIETILRSVVIFAEGLFDGESHIV